MMAAPSWGSALIPEIVFCFYELMFCACAVMIVVGGAFERGRIIPSIIFGFCWATVAYCPISYWTWNANGWLFKFGALDFGRSCVLHPVFFVTDSLGSWWWPCPHVVRGRWSGLRFSARETQEVK
jgi:ammonia channel protein AmtB